MKIRILMLTCNRPAYTRLSLARLCATAPPEAGIVVWDNASEAETVDVVRSFEHHPRVIRVVYNSTNARQVGPINRFWELAADADLIGKVDDDCLVPPGWCETLVAAHRDIPAAGALGCWSFMPEDFNAAVAAHKIQAFGRHRIMRNCWIGGSGYLMKRAVVDRLGPIRRRESHTGYLQRAAARGFIHGWYFPFLFQEHMDDPRAPHTGMKTEEDFQRLHPVSAGNFGIDSLAAWDARLRLSAQQVQACSIDPRDYVGTRILCRKAIGWLTGRLRRRRKG